MTVKLPAVLYLHGFNSSPDSLKARQFIEYCEQRKLAEVLAPALPHDPSRAMDLLVDLVREKSPVLLVGSSLGGYYATWLCERFGIPAALVNPAVAPVEHLGKEFLGRQKNYYTGEEYEFTLEHAMALRELQVNEIKDPSRYLLLVQTADEVLDYRLALDLYKGCEQLVQEGGNHSFEHFEKVLPAICRFAGLSLA